jgi:hypothetical protein
MTRRFLAGELIWQLFVWEGKRHIARISDKTRFEPVGFSSSKYEYENLEICCRLSHSGWPILVSPNPMGNNEQVLMLVVIARFCSRRPVFL